MSDPLLEQLLGVPSIVSNGRGGWLCSACGGYVRADATTCKHCHVTFGVAQPPGAPAPPIPASASQTKWRMPLVIAGVVLGILVLSCVAVVWLGSDMRRVTRVPIGQQGRIVGGDEKGVTVALTEQAIATLTSSPLSISAKREKVFAMINLALDGQLMTVPNDTAVLVLDADGDKMKIRILTGTYKDKTGWVPVSNVRP
jgi:hypothetical protein